MSTPLQFETHQDLEPYVHLVANLHRCTSISRGSSDVNSLIDYLSHRIHEARQVYASTDLAPAKRLYELGLQVAVIVTFASDCALLGRPDVLRDVWPVLSQLQVTPRAGIALALALIEDILCQIEKRPCPFATKERFRELLTASRIDLPPIVDRKAHWSISLEVQLHPDQSAQLLYTPVAVPPDAVLVFGTMHQTTEKQKRAVKLHEEVGMMPNVFPVKDNSRYTLALESAGLRTVTFLVESGEIKPLVSDSTLSTVVTCEPLPMRVLRWSQHTQKWRHGLLQKLNKQIRERNLALPFGVLVGSKSTHLLIPGCDGDLAIVKQWLEHPPSVSLAFWWTGSEMQQEIAGHQLLSYLEQMGSATRDQA